MLTVGTNLGRYKIRAKLGEGGMGEVYLAQDTKLDRKVALKILPPDVAADRSRMNRFVQEAKSASALNHPNIITIYEIDETDSGHFIATEFIDGETVRECLRKAPLTISEALNVAAQVAAALAAAHQAGIIHRDIKPENVMVRADGLVKVLDFGLAKLAAVGASDPDAATRISDTQPGMIMGTVAYMSPEQARGKALDARTDVWSLGVLLYEMLSCRPPFSGETASDTLANILHREPDPLNIGALPNDLVRIVERMLAKKLEVRYPTMADAASDLKTLQRRIEFDSEMQQTVLRSSVEAHTEGLALATAAKPAQETAADSASARTDEGFWVAVLPFKYSGSNPDLEALATINYYFEGMRTANVESLKNAFQQQAILCGYLGDEMITAPIEGLYDWVNSNPAPATYAGSVLDIEITNRVAAATVRETESHGDWIDYFHLLKVGDRWWIVSKLWDAAT